MRDPRARRRFTRRRLAPSALLIGILLAGPARAESGPVFSAGGPDAVLFGAEQGYPVGGANSVNRPPNMVGSYSHFDQIHAANLVAKAASPSALGRSPQEISVTYTHRQQTHTIEDYLTRNPATGFLIARGDTILFEHYNYARTDRDRFTSQSMAKTITGMLIGIAVAEGAIRSVDDLAEAYVPGLAGTELGKTPIRALLHMASGIAFNEAYEGPSDNAALGRTLFRRDSPGPVAAVAAFNTRTAPPDTVWHYAGLDTEVLGLVLTHATHVPMAQYLQSRVWQPMGAEADATWVTDSSGQEVAYCCFNAILRDYARFGLLLANDGMRGDRPIIPRAWVLEATSPPPPGSFLAAGRVSPFWGYGDQVWLMRGPRRAFALMGIHGQRIYVDPPSELVLVQTAVQVRPTGDPGNAELTSLWLGLLAQYGDARP